MAQKYLLFAKKKKMPRGISVIGAIRREARRRGIISHKNVTNQTVKRRCGLQYKVSEILEFQLSKMPMYKSAYSVADRWIVFTI